MSIIKTEDSKKWINAFVMILAVIVGYIVIQFAQQMGDWFDLEAKVQYYQGLAQGLGIVVGLMTFLLTVKHKVASRLLGEVYSELVKVVWPEKDSVVKLTIGVVIALVVLSGIFVAVDFLFRQVLELIY